MKKTTAFVARKKEVIIRLSSGLGNQLFQLACGLSAATDFDADLRVDTTWYSLIAPLHRPIRRFQLPSLGVSLPEAFGGLRRWKVGFAAAAFDRWGCGRNILEQMGSMRVVQEATPMTGQTIANPDPWERTYLNGYWQTANHFLAVHDKLLPMLRPQAGWSPGARNWLARIKKERAAFVHVRRGDYETVAGAHALLPVEYYRRAAGEILSHGGSDRCWFVFTEDAAWASRHLGFLKQMEIVEYNSDNRGIEDMQLMAACDAGITANSSFSWWGAALGELDNRLIVAPDKYWRTSIVGTEAWCLPTWRTVAAWED